MSLYGCVTHLHLQFLPMDSSPIWWGANPLAKIWGVNASTTLTPWLMRFENFSLRDVLLKTSQINASWIPARVYVDTWYILCVNNWSVLWYGNSETSPNCQWYYALSSQFHDIAIWLVYTFHQSAYTTLLTPVQTTSTQPTSSYEKQTAS